MIAAHEHGVRVGTSIIALLAIVASARPMPLPHRSAPPSYHVTHRWHLDSANADFLAIDAPGRHLFGASDSVLDIDAGRFVGVLPPHTGHGFALAPEFGRGIGRRGIVFDLKSFAEVATVAVAGDASVYDSLSHRAFLLGDSTAVVDVPTATRVGMIGMVDNPGLASVESGVGDGAGRVYVNVSTVRDPTRGAPVVARIVVIESRTLRIEDRWIVPGCGGSMGLTMDRSHRRLFVACNKVVVVMDADRGRSVATVAVTGAADANAFDPATQLLFNPNGDGTVAVIHEDTPDRYRVVQIATAGDSVSSLVLDPVTHRLFAFHPDDKGMRVLELSP